MNFVDRLMAASRDGIIADVVSNGMDAVEAAARKNYDLILMDCRMPVMDGIEASRRIREREAGSAVHVPIVALTGDAQNDRREECLAAGMDDFLSKPLQIEGLQTVVDRWLAPAILPANPAGCSTIAPGISEPARG